MRPVSLKNRRNAPARKKPATSPYQWLESCTLSADELAAARDHVERSLNLDEVGGI